MEWVYSDGGRAEAGRKGSAQDCVCRAVTIITGLAYADVYRRMGDHAKAAGVSRSVVRTGYPTKLVKTFLASLGFAWVPTMFIGQGCKVHLVASELPPGKLIVNLSRHIAPVINGTVYDTDDPRRNGSRCVYGYWTLTNQPKAGQ